MIKYDVIIIGAGPSGLMAATQIKNKKVLLLDKNSFLGGKIKVSGGGRCNVTNNKDNDTFLNNVLKNPRFLYPTFNNMSPQDLTSFFTNLKEEDNNRMFPVSNDAMDIVEQLQNKLGNNVDVMLNYGVTTIDGLVVDNKYSCQHLVIATGGITYPTMGTTGDGYKFLDTHKLITPTPTLTSLVCSDVIIQDKEFQGVTLKNTKTEIYINNKKKKTLDGDLLITHFGLSGPLALHISDIVRDKIPKGVRLEVKLREKVKSITEDKLVFNISDIRGKQHAFVTAGGIDVKQIDPYTFESKITNNTYVIGELLDVHCLTGGYNIATCLSMGYTCGNYINKI